MSQAAAKEVLKGSEEEKRVGSLMAWTTAREKVQQGFFLMLLWSLFAETAGRSWEKEEWRGRRPAEWRAAAVGNRVDLFLPSPGGREEAQGREVSQVQCVGLFPIGLQQKHSEDNQASRCGEVLS